MKGNIKSFIQNNRLAEFEFIALMAMLMSNVAFSIDAILPALTAIGVSIQQAGSSDMQLIITMMFLGLGIGELLFGTLSDSFGRKPIIYGGVGIVILATFICATANNLEMMLIGRVLQGIGLSAPRTVSVAIIRDKYKGDSMARIMSFIMAIFILIPMIAPLLGQLILDNFNWQAIFYFQLIFVSITVIWFKFRQKETWPKEQRIKLSKSLFFDGIRMYFNVRSTVVYTFISGLIEGVFILYLSASKQIFQDQYHLIAEFPYVFAALSLVLGLSTFFNGSLVVKLGMKKLVNWSLYLFSFSSLTYLLIFNRAENPVLAVLLLFLSIQFLSLGFIFGNLSALAMRPIGHIAGVGAALYSFVSMLMGVLIAMFVGSFIETSVMPLFVGFLIAGLLSLLLLKLVKEENSVR